MLLLITAGPVLFAGYRTARLNTSELVKQRSEAVVRSVVEHVRGQLDPVQAQMKYLTQIVARERLDLAHPRELGLLLTASFAAVPQSRWPRLSRRICGSYAHSETD